MADGTQSQGPSEFELSIEATRLRKSRVSIIFGDAVCASTLLIIFSFFLFMRLFWNQVFICFSLRSNFLHNSPLFIFDRYSLSKNSVSKRKVCSLVYDWRLRLPVNRKIKHGRQIQFYRRDLCVVSYFVSAAADSGGRVARQILRMLEIGDSGKKRIRFSRTNTTP